MNSNIRFIRQHQVYQDPEPMVSLPLADLNARIRKGVTSGMVTGMCMGAGLTALITFIGVMVTGWATA